MFRTDFQGVIFFNLFLLWHFLVLCARSKFRGIRDGSLSTGRRGLQKESVRLNWTGRNYKNVYCMYTVCFSIKSDWLIMEKLKIKILLVYYDCSKTHICVHVYERWNMYGYTDFNFHFNRSVLYIYIYASSEFWHNWYSFLKRDYL